MIWIDLDHQITLLPVAAEFPSGFVLFAGSCILIPILLCLAPNELEIVCVGYYICANL